MTVNDELERMWKEAMVEYFKIRYQHVFERLRKTKKTVRIAEILIRFLLYTKQSANYSVSSY
jgi:hypothetical protein